jgi:hypothetical protein
LLGIADEMRVSQQEAKGWLAQRLLRPRSGQWRLGQKKPGLQPKLKAAGRFVLSMHLARLQRRRSMQQVIPEGVKQMINSMHDELRNGR